MDLWSVIERERRDCRTCYFRLVLTCSAEFDVMGGASCTIKEREIFKTERTECSRRRTAVLDSGSEPLITNAFDWSTLSQLVTDTFQSLTPTLHDKFLSFDLNPKASTSGDSVAGCPSFPNHSLHPIIRDRGGSLLRETTATTNALDKLSVSSLSILSLL
jgi:hypothetical protein